MEWRKYQEWNVPYGNWFSKSLKSEIICVLKKSDAHATEVNRDDNDFHLREESSMFTEK